MIIIKMPSSKTSIEQYGTADAFLAQLQSMGLFGKQAYTGAPLMPLRRVIFHWELGMPIGALFRKFAHWDCSEQMGDPSQNPSEAVWSSDS
jgi:hypothetical protein